MNENRDGLFVRIVCVWSEFEGCGYEWAWVGWNSGRSMRVSDSIPVLNQVRSCGCPGVRVGLPALLRYNNSRLCLG